MSDFKYKGFTLIELIIVIAVIALLASAIFVSVNPGKRIGDAKDAQRLSDLTAILNAVDFYTADNASLPIEFSPALFNTKIALCSTPGELTCDGDTTNCAVIDDNNFLGSYLPNLPVDPDKLDSTDTGYYITVTSGNLLSVGACTPYEAANVPLLHSKTKGWTCGQDIINTKDNTIYGTVTALDGNCWLDRNLGAERQATAYNDTQAYGDLYQWGRYMDGHQATTSATTASLSAADTPGHGNWITIASSPYDWRSPQNDSLWQGVDGINNPCPAGWRIPTSAEFTALGTAEGITTMYTGHSSNLKLVVPGRRNESTGVIDLDGSTGYYWASSISGTNAYIYFINNGSAALFSAGYRARGASVRCIKD